MKLPLTIFLLTVALALQAAPVTPVKLVCHYGDAIHIVGFRVYWGPRTGGYEASQDFLYTQPGPADYTFKINLPPHSFVVVTAIGADGGESGWSNEIQI